MARILVIDGHPDTKSYCAALAKAYAKGARRSGAKVRTLTLRDLRFDPILHQGYRAIQPLEKDLLAAQKQIEWAEHLVLVYPTWWSSTPALLKGFFDRVFVPRWAFRFNRGGWTWQRLLSGRSARLLVTMGNLPLLYRLIGAPGITQVSLGVLRFCGISPVRTTAFGRADKTTDEKRKQWLAKVERLGERQA